MLYSEIIAVCSQIHTKHINTLRGQNVELLNVKPGGTYSDQWASKGITHMRLALDAFKYAFIAKNCQMSQTHDVLCYILLTLKSPN